MMRVQPGVSGVGVQAARSAKKRTFPATFTEVHIATKTQRREARS